MDQETAKNRNLAASSTSPGTDATEPASKHTAPSLLVVEDEYDLLEMLRYNLIRHGFRVSCAQNGEEALRQLKAGERPDLVLLDLMLPGMDGLELCRLIKGRPETSDISVVMLTAKSEETDVVAGLELGADDYIAKPFGMRLLVARIRAVLRRNSKERAEAEAEADPEVIQVDDLVIDAARHEVKLQGELLALTPTEFRLLALLASKPGRVFSRPQIIEAIHGQHVAVTDRSVDVQVLHLRRKLKQAGSKIEAVRGVGYRFRDE
jgi:two-component system phosphate regulon response regulator PhoB